MALNPRRSADPTTSRSSRNTSAAVPLGIWLCAPTPEEQHDIPALPDGITQRLINRAVKEFSPAGSRIAVTGSAPHLKDVAALAALHTDRHVTSVSVTDGDQNGPVDGSVNMAGNSSPIDPLVGSIDLVMALALPTPPNARGLTTYSRWQRWLRPGGSLVVITANPAGPGRFANHTGTVIARAEAVGLVYLQHVIAVLAHVEGDRLLVEAPRHGPPPPRRPRETVHVPAHSDILIFLNRA